MRDSSTKPKGPSKFARKHGPHGGGITMNHARHKPTVHACPLCHPDGDPELRRLASIDPGIRDLFTIDV